MNSEYTLPKKKKNPPKTYFFETSKNLHKGSLNLGTLQIFPDLEFKPLSDENPIPVYSHY